MSNVIDFLERMGQDARLRYAPQREVEMALASVPIDPELQVAILAKNQLELEVLLGHGHICCVMFPAEEEEDGPSEESPSRDDEEISLRHTIRVVAVAG